jgi:hypothetical protein
VPRKESLQALKTGDKQSINERLTVSVPDLDKIFALRGKTVF